MSDAVLEEFVREMQKTRDETYRVMYRNMLFYLGTQDLEWRSSLLACVSPKWLRRILPNKWLGSWVKSGHISR